ncbi:adenosylhomocysteinase [Candidatus Woesearchaeota archaeon]|nr:adenosylhomocysteinase [Candidatus Woesearchaeota archaeon]
MSTSFCGQALACEYAVKNRGRLPKKVIQLPGEIDDHISKLQLEAMEIKIDTLTKEQKEYLESWQEGT